MTGLPLNIDWQQIALHLFNFVLLFGGLYILLYKPVKDFIDKRQEHYKKMDEEAARTQSEADAVKAEYERKLSLVADEISQMKSEAAASAKTAADNKLREAGEQAERIVSDAKLQAQREHDKLLSQAKEEVVALATEAAARILDEKSDIYKDFAESVRQ